MTTVTKARPLPLERSERRFLLILLLPAAALLLALVGWPLLKLAHDSLFDLRLTDALPPRFVGLDNYLYALRDPDVRLALLVTLVLTVVTVPGALLLGLLLALAGQRHWRWRWPIRIALLLPWALPLSFSGMIFAWFFHTDHGVVNDLLRRVGVAPISFLLSPLWALFAVSVATIWKTSSFVAMVLLPGLMAIPRSLVEAAQVEGAGRWARFRHVTLPLLLPSLAVAAIFRTLSAIQTFDIPYTMTQGGPGRSTETLAMMINATTTEYLDIGYGSSLAVILWALSMAVNAFYLRHLAGSVR